MLAVLLSNTASAKVVLPSLFSDNMVLQRQSTVPMWGKAKASGKVTVITSWNKARYTTVANTDGIWKVALKTTQAGGPYTITVSDGTPCVLQNVMLGEVWLCSGQSNMEMPIAGWGKVNNYVAEIAAADYKEIRLFSVKPTVSLVPADEVASKGGNWQVCSPATVPDFSALAYFFGRDLFNSLHVPIGLINSSWGGTNIESWISGEALKQVPEFADAVQYVKEMSVKTPAEYDREKHEQIAKADIGFQNGKPLWVSPNLDDSGWGKVSFPGHVEKQGLDDFDGILWVRKHFVIPQQYQGHRLKMFMANIDDDDITYFNGVQVGATEGFNWIRCYEIPENLVKAGEAVVTIRIVDTSGGCGIIGDMSLKTADSNKQIGTLAGEWRYKIAAKCSLAQSFSNPNLQTVLYNGMIHPLVPFKMRGIIWYQGENNAGRAMQYRTLMPLLIQSWRKDWKEELPFYYVQLASYMTDPDTPSDPDWANLRQAQLKSLFCNKTEMAVTIDIGDANDIHPKNKQEVGRRMALIARAKLYGQTGLSFSGPRFRSWKADGAKAIVSFDYAEGLTTSDGKSITGFALAGPDHIYHWAKAVIDADRIILTAPEVQYPMSIRYGWGNHPACNLVGKSGLPASPFQTE